MKLKKVLSMLVAVVMVVFSAAFAMAESTPTAAPEQPVAAEPTAAPAAEAPSAPDAVPAAEPVTYSLDEMMTMAMTDAYARQAAYAAYAEAFPDSRGIGGIDMDTQIVLLEMLLKANGAALPTNTETVTAPETVADAYTAIATAESDAATMYLSFLRQESLPKDARIIFSSVLQSVRMNARSFYWMAQSAQAEGQWQAMMNSDNAKTYTMTSPDGRRQWTMTVYNYSSSDDTTTAADDTSATTDETAAPADTTAPAEGGGSN